MHKIQRSLKKTQFLGFLRKTNSFFFRLPIVISKKLLQKIEPFLDRSTKIYVRCSYCQTFNRHLTQFYFTELVMEANI